MNEHLTAEEISSWTIGCRSPRAELHVRECRACEVEVGRLEDTLVDFRGAVRGWSRLEAAPVAPLRWRPARTRPLRWAVALAALCAVAMVPIYRERQARQSREDAALMERVDAALARQVPAPMEPLAKLVTWKPQAGENK